MEVSQKKAGYFLRIKMKNKREIEKIIKKLTKFVVKKLKKKGLISLYLAGTILTKDRNKYSDIDFFGIVPKNFDIYHEELKINKILEKKQDPLCGGIETRFRGIGLDELNGGELRGVVKYLGFHRILRQLPKYKLLWGKELDFSKFPFNPTALKREDKNLIKTTSDFIKDFKKGKATYPIQNFPKAILHLAMTEAERDYGYQFDPSYKNIVKYLSNKRNHIVHKAIKLRDKKVTKELLLNFFPEVEKYIKHLKKKL